MSAMGTALTLTLQRKTERYHKPAAQSGGFSIGSLLGGPPYHDTNMLAPVSQVHCYQFFLLQATVRQKYPIRITKR